MAEIGTPAGDPTWPPGTLVEGACPGIADPVLPFNAGSKLPGLETAGVTKGEAPACPELPGVEAEYPGPTRYPAFSATSLLFLMSAHLCKRMRYSEPRLVINQSKLQLILAH